VLLLLRILLEKQQEQYDEGGPMPQITTQEFERLPLRVHDFLAGVPLHDVWAVDLPRARFGITLDEFLRTTLPDRFPHIDPGSASHGTVEPQRSPNCALLETQSHIATLERAK
jgi:hypothetical protein